LLLSEPDLKVYFEIRKNMPFYFHGLDPSSFTTLLCKFARKIRDDPRRALSDPHIYAAIGFLSLLPLAKRALEGLYSLLRARSLKQIGALYKPSSVEGDSSWVVVTGATAGIGKAFCHQFARLGFNIVAVSRDQAKLDELEREILAIDALVKVRTVQVDFTKTYQNQDLQAAVVDKIKDLDISILVNNVGLGECYAFHELHSTKIRNIIHTNVYPQVYLTRGLISQLKQRSTTRKTAIINLSSVFGTEVFLPYFSVYSATKSFNDYFSKALAAEHPSIDILSVRPGRVKTNMNETAKATPEAQVKGLLRYLGVKTETNGTFRSYREANFGTGLYWAVKGLLRKRIYKVYQEKYRQEMIQQGDLPLVIM
jgi:17beta-estradiol 17-dehydrogenase / very-long-chain 3-oxoacyl-CoA reductase